MKRLIIVAAIAVLVTSCSSAPTTPTQPAPTPEPPAATATIVMNGNMAIANCVLSGDSFTCDFTAPARNSGTGCAQNIRGTLRTYRPKPFDSVMGSSAWTYAGMVRPGEAFTYRGAGAVVTQESGWTYTTEFAWDNVRCP